jgi:hypothetical protein
VPAILDAVTRKDTERRALVGELAGLQQAAAAPVLDVSALRRELRSYVDSWQEVTRRHVTETRALLGTILEGCIVFRNVTERAGTAMYELTVPIHYGKLLKAAVPSFARVGMASPTGVVQEWTREVPGEVKAA